MIIFKSFYGAAKSTEMVIKMQKFYNSEEEFNSIYAKLKLLVCPNCNLSGFLIRHGCLYGYSEKSNAERIKRGYRIFCSSRIKGCGKTFSFLHSDFIKKFTISAKTVWKFLEKIKEAASLAEAFRASDCTMEQTTPYRLSKKFKLKQSSIRTLLTRIKEIPMLQDTADAVIQTIVHLKSAFESGSCPISQFQHHFQTSFF